MPSLRSLQTEVMSALLSGEPGPAAALIAAGGAAPFHRRAAWVYTATMCAAIFHDSLISSFPQSGAWWERITFDRRRANTSGEYPSRSGDLLHVGRGFASYWRTCTAPINTATWPMWRAWNGCARNRSSAAEHAALDLERLRGVAPGDTAPAF